jgi:hypothetical protein
MVEPKISYTDRSFQSVRAALINWIKIRFPKDWPEIVDTGIGMALIDSVAWAHGQRAYYYDMQARNSFLETATLPEHILVLARQLGYERRLSTGASVPVIFSPQPTQHVPITIKKGEKITADGLYFESIETYVIPPNAVSWPREEDSTIAIFSEGETKKENFISSGTPFQTFQLSQPNFLQNSLKIEIDGESWEKTDSLILIEGNTIASDIFFGNGESSQSYKLTLLNAIINKEEHTPSVSIGNQSWAMVDEFSGSPMEYKIDQNEDGESVIMFGDVDSASAPGDGVAIDVHYLISGSQKRFVTSHSLDGKISIRFGDGTYGRIPQEGASIECTYRVGNGVKGNISRGLINTSIRGYISSGSGVNVLVFNAESGSGGEDAESFDRVKFLAPKYAMTSKKAVRSQDYSVLAMSYNDEKYGSPSFAHAKLKQKIPELNTVQLALWSRDSDGRISKATSALKYGLLNFMNAHKSTCVTIEIIDGEVLYFDIELDVALKSGYSLSDASEAVSTLLENYFNSAVVRPGVDLAMSLLVDKILEAPQISHVTIKNIIGTTKTSIDYGQNTSLKTTFEGVFNFPRGQQIIPKSFAISGGLQKISDNGDGTLGGDIDESGENAIDYLGGKFTATFKNAPGVAEFVMAECRFEAKMNTVESLKIPETNSVDFIAAYSPILKRRNIGLCSGTDVSLILPEEYLPFQKHHVAFIGGYDHYGMQSGGQLLAYDDGEGNILGDVASGGKINYDSGQVNFVWNTNPAPEIETFRFGYLEETPDGIRKKFTFSTWTLPDKDGTQVNFQENYGRIKLYLDTIVASYDAAYDNGTGNFDGVNIDAHEQNTVDYSTGTGLVYFKEALPVGASRNFPVVFIGTTLLLYTPLVGYYFGSTRKILLAENSGHLFGTLSNAYPYSNLDYDTGHLKADLTYQPIVGKNFTIDYDTYFSSRYRNLNVPSHIMPALSVVSLTETIEELDI